MKEPEHKWIEITQTEIQKENIGITSQDCEGKQTHIQVQLDLFEQQS